MSVEKSFACYSIIIRRIDDYAEEILKEIDEYVHEKRQRESKEEDPSLNLSYIVSKELEAITGKQECSGKEVFFNVLLVILDSKMCMEIYSGTPAHRSLKPRDDCSRSYST